MTLEIVTFQLGPAQTNAYLIADSESGSAAVIDPAWDGHIILTEALRRGWRIAHLWYTHAHFDHIGGAGAIADALNPLPLVALHPADHDLWKAAGGGPLFGFDIDPGPEPTIDFYQGQLLRLGHVVFYCQADSLCFCGDLIFSGSVGRTDLPGGDWEKLVASIQSQIYTLPDQTRLLSGHGPETTVGEEKVSNPYVRME